MSTIISTIKADIERVLEDHQSILETSLGDAAKVAGSPLAQVVLGLLHVPAGIQEEMASFLQELDADYADKAAKLAAASPASAEAPAEAPADPSPVDGADSADAASPVAAVAYRGNGTGTP